MAVNKTNHPDFKMPDPPNDQKKRKDEIFDITHLVKKGKNNIDIFQEQRDYKNDYFAHPGHICAVYLVKLSTPHDVTNFISTHKIEPPSLSLSRT
jgi:hypothetical protein